MISRGSSLEQLHQTNEGWGSDERGMGVLCFLQILVRIFEP